MNNQYYICCVAGSGGMFLSTVIAKYLGFNCPTIIADNGLCHDLGQGIWKSNNCIDLFGDHWNGKASKCPIIFSHDTNFNFVQKVMPNIKIVLIDYDDTDLLQIATFRTMKAYTLMWSQEEYNKIAGPNWPLYHPDNLTQSNMIRDECINFRILDTKQWISSVDRTLVDYKIDFKIIYNGDVSKKIAEILSVSESISIRQFVLDYQQINQHYYGTL